MQDLKDWTPRPLPQREKLEGRYVRLEPLSATAHGPDLFEASSVPDAQARFRWLSDDPPQSLAAFQPGWRKRRPAPIRYSLR